MTMYGTDPGPAAAPGPARPALRPHNPQPQPDLGLHPPAPPAHHPPRSQDTPMTHHTVTLVWCADRNAYADTNSCGTQGVGISHAHYEIDVDDATGRVLTSPEEQYDRRRRASYFVAPDGLDQLVLWRGQPGDTRPQPILVQGILSGHPLLWDQLTAGLQVEQ